MLELDSFIYVSVGLKMEELAHPVNIVINPNAMISNTEKSDSFQGVVDIRGNFFAISVRPSDKTVKINDWQG